MPMSDSPSGLTRDDLEAIDALGAAAAELEEDSRRRARRAWERAASLLDDLATTLGGFRAELWPWRQEDDTFPFLWGRLKERRSSEFATHLGLFVSADHCNFCIDLEKDRVEAGESRESASDVRAYYRNRLPDLLPPEPEPPAPLRVWTDPDNVVEARRFGSVDFAEFMAASGDPEHPWPRLGYLMDVGEHVGFGGRWIEEMQRRAEPLLPVYRDMLRAFGD